MHGRFFEMPRPPKVLCPTNPKVVKNDGRRGAVTVEHGKRGLETELSELRGSEELPRASLAEKEQDQSSFAV
jgi:hypothetical protein